MNNSMFDVNRIFFKLQTTKRWWIPVFIVVVILVNILGLFRPAKYTASAQVQILQPPISDATIQQTFNLSDVLDTLYQRISSPSFLAAIATKLNLDAGIDPNSAAYDSLLKRMREAIDLRKTKDYFQVTFTWFTPKQAFDVTNEIVNQVIAQSTDFYSKKADKIVMLYQTQLTQQTLQMQQAQEAIKDYKKKHPNEIPDAKLVHVESLAKARHEYEADLQQIAQLKNYVQEGKLQLSTTPESIRQVSRADTSNLQVLQNQRAQAKMKLDTMLQTFTDDHWEVRSMRDLLTSLDNQITSATAQVTEEVNTMPNPKHQEWATKIVNYQMQISSLQAGLQAKQDEIRGYERYLEAIPLHEHELRTLEREYNTHASQVEWLRSRLNSAQQARYVDVKGGGPSYYPIARPRMPTSPSSPNRIKIALASLFLGGCAAGGLVLLFVFLDRTVRTIDEARNLLHMPMLGTVQKIVTPSQLALAQRRRLYRAVGVAMVLIILGGAGYAAAAYYQQEVIYNLGRVRDFMKTM